MIIAGDAKRVSFVYNLHERFDPRAAVVKIIGHRFTITDDISVYNTAIN